jgi:hypothetical protein
MQTLAAMMLVSVTAQGAELSGVGLFDAFKKGAYLPAIGALALDSAIQPSSKR